MVLSDRLRKPVHSLKRIGGLHVGSLLLQNGASIVYVKEQMGHSSIQVTVDIYGHLIPGADVCYVDRLDAAEPRKTTPQQSATPAQQNWTERDLAMAEAMREAAESSGYPRDSRRRFGPAAQVSNPIARAVPPFSVRMGIEPHSESENKALTGSGWHHSMF